MHEHDIVKPSETRTLFQFDTSTRDWPSSGLKVGSEFDIAAVGNNTQQKLFFDDLRGMLSVDEKLRKRTSRYKQSVLVGEVVEISADRRNIKINIKAKGSNINSTVFDYLKLEPCLNNCEFSMDEHSSPTLKHKFQIEYNDY